MIINFECKRLLIQVNFLKIFLKDFKICLTISILSEMLLKRESKFSNEKQL